MFGIPCLITRSSVGPTATQSRFRALHFLGLVSRAGWPTQDAIAWIECVLNSGRFSGRLWRLLAEVLVNGLPCGIVDGLEIGKGHVGDVKVGGELNVCHDRRGRQVGKEKNFIASPGHERLVPELILDHAATADLHRYDDVHRVPLKGSLISSRNPVCELTLVCLA